ncbi:MAG: phosphatase PAP2 family protein [Flavobacteriaceae bacterium]
MRSERHPADSASGAHDHPPPGLVKAGAVAGLAVFAAAALAVGAGWTDGIDRAVLLSLREAGDPSNPIGPPWFEEAAAEITALGGYPVLVTVSAVVLGVLLLLGKRAASAFLVVALIGGTALSTALKLVFERPRPDLVEHLDRTFTASFPSGHATVGMLAWLTLAAIALPFVPQRRVRVFLLGAAFALALAIGASRVYLGVHWPSDVVAGWGLGLAWASLAWLAARGLRERGNRRGEG